MSSDKINPFSPVPNPPTALGRYRVLSARAGVRVSPLCLGAMSIGDKWGDFGFGVMDKETSFKLLDAFYDAGGNFIDTANGYQEETSEKFIGEWMEKRGVRDQIVVATKYSINYKRTDTSVDIKINYGGNNVKTMHVSVEESLKKLRTSYIDILYVHIWDWGTSIEEVMDALHNLVASGKVLYLGVSDTPAWVVALANQYARDHGKTPFVIYQGRWNVLMRDFEREILPLARHQGMALAPWDVLAGGKIRTDEEEERRKASGEKGRDPLGLGWERSENEKKMSAALEKIVGEVGSQSIQAVAIAYIMQKTPYVFPIIGGRKIEHLHSNIGALDIALTPEHIKQIESVVPFDVGFPNNFIGSDADEKDSFFIQMGGHPERWPLRQAIRPTKST
ncbi:aryl-alcohol dehydrogenase [NADP+] [Peniophora sp. CONT]|nr:aryl-alcohol dehydrogenase [NADP+] [Peniophora sp. CONT]